MKADPDRGRTGQKQLNMIKLSLDQLEISL